MIVVSIIKGIVALVAFLISLILAPINLLIVNYLPSLDSALASVNTLMETIGDSFSYAVSWTFLSPLALSMVVAYFSFMLVFPLAILSIKIFVKWFAKIKP